VLVQDGQVAAVGTDLAAPRDALVVTGDNRTLLPGLIDSHTHAAVPGALEQAIVFGVTTELDMFAADIVWRRRQGTAVLQLGPDRSFPPDTDGPDPPRFVTISARCRAFDPPMGH
jgi:predicted amidohydrolase YtcJ